MPACSFFSEYRAIKSPVKEYSISSSGFMPARSFACLPMGLPDRAMCFFTSFFMSSRGFLTYSL